MYVLIIKRLNYIGTQFSTQSQRIRKAFLHQSPKRWAVIKVFKVAKFMHNNIVPQFFRKQHELAVERECLAR